MQKLIVNGFSGNMVAPGLHVRMDWKPVSLAEASRLAASGEFRSVVGHPDTAVILGELLGTSVPCNRETVTLRGAAELLLGSYRGPRLQEGAHKLPEGASIDWFHVVIET